MKYMICAAVTPERVHTEKSWKKRSQKYTRVVDRNPNQIPLRIEALNGF